MTIELYGIPNCDTVKKARKWLEANALDYAFHDYKKEGADAAHLADWIEQAGVATVLNKRGTTYRKLSDQDKARLEADQTGEAAVILLQENPSMIKRPVATHAGGILIGFKEDEWTAALV
jgi:Spx/MgsR family transcriptional regulator